MKKAGGTKCFHRFDKPSSPVLLSRTHGERFNFPITSVLQKYKTYVLKGINFDLQEKYSEVAYVSKGSYGTVCSAYDKNMKTHVIIKKISDVLKQLEDGKKALGEVLYLEHLKGHQNIVFIHNIELFPPYLNKFQDLYIVMERWPIDLDTLISRGVELTQDHIQFILYQLVCGTSFMHSAGIIHRDLKPANILVGPTCNVAICDLGLARAFDLSILEPDPLKPSIKAQMSNYVVTRWYRAPELLVENTQYSYGIDVWSLGCILGEIFTQKPLFPGRSRKQQLKMIIDMIGKPSEEELRFIQNWKIKNWIRHLTSSSTTASLKDIFSGAPPSLLDLLQKSLVFSPEKRITLPEIFKHPYLKELLNHNRGSTEKHAGRFDTSFENNIQSIKDLRNWFWLEFLFSEENSKNLANNNISKQKRCFVNQQFQRQKAETAKYIRSNNPKPNRGSYCQQQAENVNPNKEMNTG
eukprot:augustus_masked-scaffold_1-processed-gene-19.13-mRNA-1 protein AED:0.12 eAED:0.12 QI:0/-1/0/1/-1/1/1/0/465